MTKTFYCTLDTETVGGCTNPKGFYHIGGKIHDRVGNVVATFNYIVASLLDDILTDDYAKKHIDYYSDYTKFGPASAVATEEDAIFIIDSLLKHYNVKVMMAFNSGFDFGKTKAKALLEGREFIDLYLMAVQTIGKRKSYEKFCKENKLYSKNGKSIAGTAESFYAYITNNPQYEEEHTAFEDAAIELEIFNACIKTHKKFTRNCIFYDYKNPDKWLARVEG